MNLPNALTIKDRAEAKMSSDPELDTYLSSIDYLEDELARAYERLRVRVGTHRANEVTTRILKY